MSFDPTCERRFTEVIAPAVGAVRVNGVPLEPHRVDISQSGDPILTEIMDGIAHARMVLADVSTVGRDAKTSRPYRNANVMYEVGIALACRQPSEVLLIRDDDDPILFDVSAVPHLRIDFTETNAARAVLTRTLVARLNEQRMLNDARVQVALSGLSFQEIQGIKLTRQHPAGNAWKPSESTIQWAMCLGRLLDKGVIVVAGESEEGEVAYRYTPLGLAVKDAVCGGLPKYTFPKADTEEALAADGGQADGDQ